MEGVFDAVLRKLITHLNPYEICFSEFIKVNQVPAPKKAILQIAPELQDGGKTLSGCPVYIQLLGNNPTTLAQTAMRAVELGALGIDLNFGCPAKKVIQHGSGAYLLDHTDRLFEITKSVRKALPEHIPLFAKIRTGNKDDNLCIENALALQEAGIEKLTVHARLATSRYDGEADWQAIAKINESLKINVIANGGIWTIKDYEKCQSITNCKHFMLARGAYAQPDLAAQISSEKPRLPWVEIHKLVRYSQELYQEKGKDKLALARTKQWLKHLQLSYPEAKELFALIRTQS
jgi:tRNA-dihydrouridine synthase C